MFPKVSGCPHGGISGPMSFWGVHISGTRYLPEVGMSWGWVFPGGRYIQGLGMSREGRYVQLGGGYIRGWVCPGGGYVWRTGTHPLDM